MKYTNRANLPAPLVAAITYSDYDGEKYDITASSLVMPPRLRQLMRRHANEITEDVSERIWALIGSVGHAILERAPADNVFREERLVGVMDGWTIGGKVDLLRLKEGRSYPMKQPIMPDEFGIDDYKLTSIWATKDEKPEWTMQLNVYAWLARQHGFNITQLRIIAILRDWSKLRAAREPDYPQVGVVVREVPLWPEDICERNIRAAVALHQIVQAEPDDDRLPMCTPAERWQKPEVWAVKKMGNKRAMPGGLQPTLEAAQAMIANMKGNFEIEHRPGVDTRCVSYCPVKDFCSHGKTLTSPVGEEAA